MDSYGHFSWNAASEILQHYSLGTLQELKPLSNGFANENYKIETAKDQYLLRICMEQALEMIHYEMNLMQTLQENNFPTAYPIARKDGAYVTLSESYTVVIYEYKAGVEPSLTCPIVTEIADALAKLHSIKTQDAHKKENVINIPDALKMIEEFPNKNCQYPKIFSAFTRLVTFLQKPLQTEIPQGIIHADLFPDNTLFIANKLSAIIDFEEACVDNFLFDVGMTINGFCFLNNKLDEKLIRQFLKSYMAIRLLTGKEAELLFYYIIWGATGMAYWHLRHLLNRPCKKQEERVSELLNRAHLFKNTYSSSKIISLLK